MIELKFFYQQNKHCKAREAIITSLTNATAQIIELPKSIEVCLYNLNQQTFGGVDKAIHNRIGINYSLDLFDIPKILVHELVHINQFYTGMLSIKNNTYYWHNIPYSVVTKETSYQEYNNFPWEIDANERLDEVLTKAIELSKQKHLPES